ncbi:ribosomal protein L6 [Penaeus vannamei]|uniref:Large ribosomal subunit protein eL6 n=1 Tax=Penaeus vannamei TaxID=6689 RepID=A0A423SBM6_PENVA|nr:ribosomal protein L6 [Penaeus vannamei]
MVETKKPAATKKAEKAPAKPKAEKPKAEKPKADAKAAKPKVAKAVAKDVKAKPVKPKTKLELLRERKPKGTKPKDKTKPKPVKEKKPKQKEPLGKKPLKAGCYRIWKGKKEIIRRKNYIVKPIGGANNGNARRVLQNKRPAYYAAQLNKKYISKRKPKTNFKRLRPSITPGTVCIIVAGVHKGKKVVFLKRLVSGLCLVTDDISLPPSLFLFTLPPCSSSFSPSFPFPLSLPPPCRSSLLSFLLAFLFALLPPCRFLFALLLLAFFALLPPCRFLFALLPPCRFLFALLPPCSPSLCSPPLCSPSSLLSLSLLSLLLALPSSLLSLLCSPPLCSPSLCSPSSLLSSFALPPLCSPSFLSCPFKINACPLRRVNQIYLIATATKLDISKVEIPKHINDRYFRRGKTVRSKKEEGDIFGQKTEKYVASEQRKKDQEALDAQLITAIKEREDKKMFFGYLGSYFGLRNRMYPHIMKF